ncbi:MAG: ammonium transporter [Armatimonadota bacterium]|nr:ammonium transporter [Armatimonadota bacterium]
MTRLNPRLRLLALCVLALLSLSLAAFAQAPNPPGPATTTAPATTPATTAAAVPTAQTPPPVFTADIAKDVSDAKAASLTAEGASRGDTAWMIVATALVMFMTPGLAFFYGGLARSKNILNTLMMSFVALAIISVQWMLWGYSVAFGNDVPINSSIAGIIGKPTQFLGLHGVGAGLRSGLTIPESIFMLFQMTFAIITPALISGAVVERMKFGAYCLFILLWATFFYDPLAHMVWGGGYIGSTLHAIDFAGGTVVHISSGVSALTLAFMLGKRKGHGSDEMRPHNVPMVLLGAAILWFGWFGFNAGSELAADGVACAAFINTHIATAAAALSWVLVEWIRFKKPTAVGLASGAVAGLVAITPACGFVNATAALIIGLVVSPICFSMIQLKHKLNKYDDALDVFGVHACGGVWGALATGLFANDKVNSAITGALGASNGIFAGGDLKQFGRQLVAVLMTIVMAVVATLVLGTITKLVCGGLRAPADEEENGLDVTEHGEEGYSGENAGAPAFAGVG